VPLQEEELRMEAELVGTTASTFTLADGVGTASKAEDVSERTFPLLSPSCTRASRLWEARSRGRRACCAH